MGSFARLLWDFWDVRLGTTRSRGLTCPGVLLTAASSCSSAMRVASPHSNGCKYSRLHVSDPKPRRGVLAPCRGPCSIGSSSNSSSSRCVVARMYNLYNDDLADRKKEVWDDEEDIQAAIQRMGLKDKDQKAGDVSPLLTLINKLYLDKDFPEAYVGQLEIRFFEGKGYGLVATQNIQKGQVLAICPPLAWLSGPPGKPPRLEALIRHVSNSRYNSVQLEVLHSLCSLPAIDEAHFEQYEQEQKQNRQDRLLQAARQVEATAGKGTPVSSIPLSKSAELKRMQQRLQQDRGLDLDEAADDNSFNSRSKIGINRWRRASNGAGRRIMQAAAEQRTAPDLLQLLKCTARDDTAAAAVAGTPGSLGSSQSSSSSSRNRSSRVSPAGSGSSLQQLDMSAGRLTALICRNALAEMCQDLPVCSTRGDRPASLTGIWPLLALFNHSCAANAVAVLTGGLPTATAQQQKLLQQGRQAAAAAGGSTAHGSSSSSGPVNRWAKGSTRRAAQQSNSAADHSNKGGSSSSGNAPLSAPGSGVLGLSSEPGVGPFVIVRAVTDMEPGDEITLDYLAPGVEGSLIHPERRRAALAQRWGFRCRCERCTAEDELGSAVSRTQHSATALAARLGPQLSAAIAAGDKDTPQAAATSLSNVVMQLERQVNSATIPPRVAAWAHASVYQAHALLAVCRMDLAPTTLPSLATVGTALEVAGSAAPGSSGHVFGAASLLLASQDTWGDEDERTHAAARGLLEVLQLRYGPLDATVAQQLVASAQRWAYELSHTRLGLVAPAAAAAARARLALAAAASKQQQQTPTVAGIAAASAAGDGASSSTAAVQDTQTAQSVVESAAEEEDALANALELEAEEVLEVTDEILQDIYDDPEAQVDQPPPVDIVVKQRSEQAVLEELQVFAGFTQALSPEQKQQQLLQQMLAQQQQQQQQEEHEQDALFRQPAQKSVAVAAIGSDEVVIDGDDIEAVDLPMASWLQEGRISDADAGDAVAAGLQQQQQQQKLRPEQAPNSTGYQQQPLRQPRQQQQVPANSPAAAAAAASRSEKAAAAAASRAGNSKGVFARRKVNSVFSQGVRVVKPVKQQQAPGHVQQQPAVPPTGNLGKQDRERRQQQGQAPNEQ